MCMCTHTHTHTMSYTQTCLHRWKVKIYREVDRDIRTLNEFFFFFFEKLGKGPKHFLFYKKILRDFPGGPGVETPPFSVCVGGCWFYPWSGNWDPTCCEAIKPAHRSWREACAPQPRLHAAK